MASSPSSADAALAAFLAPDLASASNALLASLEALHAADDLDRGLAAVADELARTVAYDTLAVLELDAGGRQLSFRFARGVPQEVVAHWRFGLGQGLAGRVAERRVPLLLDAAERPTLDGLGAEIAAPLIARGRLIGVLSVGSRGGDPFSQVCVQTVRFLAGHLATALETARLHQALGRQSRSLALLQEAAHELTATLDQDDLMRRLAGRVEHLIDFWRFSVLRCDHQARQLRAVCSVLRGGDQATLWQVPLGAGVSGAAAALRQPVRVGDTRLDPRYINCDEEERTRSELAVPLLAEGRLIGVLDVESDRVDAFSDEDQQLLSTLGSHLAVALENAELYGRLQADERALEADLATARQVQRHLLPRKTPWIPGLETAVAYQPARHLGGDLYDILPFGGARAAIAVGDVAGKGTGAALYGSLAVGLLRGFLADIGSEPRAALDYLNGELRPLKGARRFIAMAVAVYDGSRCRVTLANAGLPYPLRMRDGEVEEIEVPGLPVAAMAASRYRQVTLELCPGDVLVFTSDGIDECRDGDGEAFGAEGLSAVLKAQATASARVIADAVMAATDRHLGGRDAADDRTVVVLRVAADECAPARAAG